MDTRNSLVLRSTGFAASAMVRTLVLAIALVAAALFVALVVGTGTRSTTSHAPAASVTQQATDAVERNDIYAAALAARSHQSSDGGDRNAQIAYGQMLRKFNDQSPDAQGRNIELSGR